MDHTVKDFLNMKEIREMLDQINPPIAFRRTLVDLTGSVNAALMLSQAIYWQERASQKDGWWYKSIDEWQEETGLSRYKQQTARKKCRKYLLSRLRDIPARLFWKVDRQALKKDLCTLDPRIGELYTHENQPKSLVDSQKMSEGNQSASLVNSSRQVEGGQPASMPDSRKQVGGLSQNINKNTETTTEKRTETAAENIAWIEDEEPLPPPPLYMCFFLQFPYEDRSAILDFLETARVSFPENWIKDALTDAVLSDHRSLNGVRDVLQKCKRDGRNQFNDH